MKKLFSVLLLIYTCITFSQETKFVKPDYTAIEKSSKDKNSPYYFEKLMARFNKADSTMTTEECRHLYYGYSFTKDYKPYATSDSKKELNTLLNKDGDFTKDEMEKALALTDEVLQVYPFDISMMQYRRYFYRELGKDTEANLENIRIGLILEAIMSTGDGVSADTAIYIIKVSNEYEILGVLDFEFGGQQKLMGDCDYLKLAKNEYGLMPCILM